MNRVNSTFNFLYAVRNAWRKSGFDKAQERGEILAKHLQDYKPPAIKDKTWAPKEV